MASAASSNPAHRPSGGFAGTRSVSPGGRPPGTPREASNPAHRPSGGPGLYDSQYEHDACGVGFVADLSGRKTHHTVAQALTVLRNLDHRGAKGSDPDTGDGAGILTQMPDALFRASCGFDLPAAVGLGVRDGAQAAEVAGFADGVIVGSAFVQRLLDAPDLTSGVQGVRELAGDLAAGVRRPARATR